MFQDDVLVSLPPTKSILPTIDISEKINMFFYQKENKDVESSVIGHTN